MPARQREDPSAHVALARSEGDAGGVARRDDLLRSSNAPHLPGPGRGGPVQCAGLQAAVTLAMDVATFGLDAKVVPFAGAG